MQFLYWFWPNFDVGSKFNSEFDSDVAFEFDVDIDGDVVFRSLLLMLISMLFSVLLLVFGVVVDARLNSGVGFDVDVHVF